MRKSVRECGRPSSVLKLHHVQAADDLYKTSTNRSRMTIQDTDFKYTSTTKRATSKLKKISQNLPLKLHKTESDINEKISTDENSTSFTKYLTREIKYNIIENKLDKYVDEQRNEIYARMRLPKVLMNHYSKSSCISSASVGDDQYDIFDGKDLNASKSISFA
mmetsp:Transcript_22335/g.19835  ORF Transcript_22335/g.19835 Transcript_22335/m.19835 type:complete len:163 (+) Transcript_22335:129-617(+)